MHVFGLTGGIACGKSAVAARLRARGVPVIDADALAREIVLPGTDGLAAVVAEFGPGVLAADGTLDRKALGALVFADPSKRARLGAITHPRIAAASAARIGELAARGEPLACYEAALLVDNGVQDAFRPLVVVTAPRAVRIARLVRRDGLTEAEANARIDAQISDDRRNAAADFLVENAGTLAELDAAVDRVLAAVAERSGVDAARYGLARAQLR
jgi:dephospho-CoA kinase